WYFKNFKKLWKNYTRVEDMKVSRKENKVALKLLSDYKSVDKQIRSMRGTKYDIHPMVDLTIHSKKDTLHIQATSHFPYMITWYDFETQYYILSSDISINVAELFQFNNESNRDRLLGANFEFVLMDEIYKNYLKPKLEKTEDADK